MRTVLFTGAGASRAIGYPVTSELLPRVRSELKTGELFDGLNSRARERKDRDDLRRYLRRLLPGFAACEDRELPLITDVFSLVEHAITSGEALPVGGEDTLRHCRNLLKQAIADVLLGDFIAPWVKANAEHTRARKTLARFADWYCAQGKSLGLVTTNYDIGLEHEVFNRVGRKHVAERLDLGFDWRETGSGAVRTRPANPELRMYKLHGSLNQLRCSTCGYVYFNEAGQIAWLAFAEKLSNLNVCHCRDDERLDLHIVSPSFVRTDREANLMSVWRSAMEWMRRARHWIIVGYSLPPEDLAVRSLLLRAHATAPRKPRITVVSQGRHLEPRYRLLFPGCRYEAEGLEGFLARNAD